VQPPGAQAGTAHISPASVWHRESRCCQDGLYVTSPERPFLDSGSRPDAKVPEVALTYGGAHGFSLCARIARYETTAERSYYRAIRELAKLQNRREQNSGRQQADTAHEIRSVQQNQPSGLAATAEIRSAPQSHVNYTPEEIEMASLTLSKEDFEALLDKITAPPSVKAVK
jgi:hypothetical protein